MIKFLRRTASCICVLLMMNIVLLLDFFTKEESFIFSRIFYGFFLWITIGFFYLLTEILPCYEKGLKLRLQVLSGGYELIVTSAICLFMEITGYIVFFCTTKLSPLAIIRRYTLDAQRGLLIMLAVNVLMASVFLFIHYINGFLRTAFCSAQLGIVLRLLMLFFWWLPPFNLVLFAKWCAIVRREILYEKNRYLLDAARVESSVCRTRFPVIMVHGVFFRDWQYLNYWGRIPQALKRNGAAVFYGRQQSSLSIANSAAELKQEILHVLAQTGAEKVNIVAHSKGGLDARFAISHLGMAPYVASLTTINTPHRGCQFADALLASLPQWLICFTASRYNAMFHKLGDNAPDFLSGVQDLTAASCAVFNSRTPDMPNVFYQSVASKMHSMRSAGFPLNIGYLLCKKYEGDNDGLVSVSSAVWRNYMGVLSAGKKGISHGDMIDLTHKNIKGFDVCEFYVLLFAGLKKRGF